MTDSDKLTASIPDPYRVDGSYHKIVSGSTPTELARAARDFIERAAYGASDVGGKFNLFRNGALVGTLAYNGKIQLLA